MTDAWITKVAHIVWENVAARIPPEDTPLLLVALDKDQKPTYFVATYSDEAWWEQTVEESIEDMGYIPKFFTRIPEVV